MNKKTENIIDKICITVCAFAYAVVLFAVIQMLAKLISDVNNIWQMLTFALIFTFLGFCFWLTLKLMYSEIKRIYNLK